MFNAFHLIQPSNITEYHLARQTIISSEQNEKQSVDYENNIFIHFTFCTSMLRFPNQFSSLWHKYFASSPIQDLNPILGPRNVNNLQLDLISKRIKFLDFQYPVWLVTLDTSFNLLKLSTLSKFDFFYFFNFFVMQRPVSCFEFSNKHETRRRFQNHLYYSFLYYLLIYCWKARVGISRLVFIWRE